jgi:hypothetical protein
MDSKEGDFDKSLCVVTSMIFPAAFVLLRVRGGENVLAQFTNTLVTLWGQHSMCMLVSDAPGTMI